MEAINTCEAEVSEEAKKATDGPVRPTRGLPWHLLDHMPVRCVPGAILGIPRVWQGAHGRTAVGSGQWLRSTPASEVWVEWKAACVRGVRCAFLVVPEKGRAATSTTHDYYLQNAATVLF